MFAFHLTLKKHLPAILSSGLIPGEGPRSRKLGETQPAIYLFVSEDTATEALMNWLGEELPENEPVVLLRVQLSPDVKLGPSSYEIVVYEPIPPESLEVVRENL